MKTAREVITHEIGAIGSESYEVDPWEQQADNIIGALDAAGYVIVPKEPTEEMLKAGADDVRLMDLRFDSHKSVAEGAYEAMIDAALSETPK